MSNVVTMLVTTTASRKQEISGHANTKIIMLENLNGLRRLDGSLGPTLIHPVLSFKNAPVFACVILIRMP